MSKAKKRKIRIVVGVILTAVMTYGGWYMWCHYYPKLRDRYKKTNWAAIVKSEYRFGDINITHLQAAQKYGIKPVENREELLTDSLAKIESCDKYLVEPLTYSVPYLTPKSAELLAEIGTRFQAALKAQGLEKNRVIVTSVLRTEDDVKRLQKTNGNASAYSAHQYATTFDITYIRFDRMSTFGDFAETEQLANVLGSVLKQLRDEGRCYVKYEQNQRCFHITSINTRGH